MSHHAAAGLSHPSPPVHRGGGSGVGGEIAHTVVRSGTSAFTWRTVDAFFRSAPHLAVVIGVILILGALVYFLVHRARG